jgi:serine/threonine-protein kinase RsbW
VSTSRAPVNQSTDRSGDPSEVPEPAEFVLELPSDLRMIEAAVAYLVSRCQAFAFKGSRLTLNLRVGVTEALANAMLYGNGRDPSKRVRVEVVLDCTRVALRVIDEGIGFDPDSVPDPTAAANLERPGGRGLFLLRKLMDEVEYNDCGNAVRLVLHREPSLQNAS